LRLLRMPSAPARSVVVESVLADLPAQGVAVNAQHLSGAALIAVSAFQGTFDKALFKFAHGFIKQNSTVYHLADKSF